MANYADDRNVTNMNDENKNDMSIKEKAGEGIPEEAQMSAVTEKDDAAAQKTDQDKVIDRSDDKSTEDETAVDKSAPDGAVEDKESENKNLKTKPPATIVLCAGGLSLRPDL